MSGLSTPPGNPTLEGYRVVVTRPRPRSATLVEALRARGATVMLAPAVETRPPMDPRPLRRALDGTDRFDWIVFTSATAVSAVADHIDEIAGPGRARIATVGRATAAAVRERGWVVEIVPTVHTAEGLLSALERQGSLRDLHILLPVADRARDMLPEGLRERGARVTRVTAYRTVPAPPEVFADVRRALESGSIDLLTFTSPSTAASFLDSIGPEALSVPVAAIGPVTGGAAERMGYRVVAVAAEPSVAALVAAVEEFLTGSEDTV